jgi:restriction system protein
VARFARVSILNAELRDEILDKVKQLTPEHFEELVSRLLHAMGYGDSLKDVEGVPRGLGGGIDGTIEENKLGLDSIYSLSQTFKSNAGSTQSVEKRFKSFKGY